MTKIRTVEAKNLFPKEYGSLIDNKFRIHIPKPRKIISPRELSLQEAILRNAGRNFNVFYFPSEEVIEEKELGVIDC